MKIYAIRKDAPKYKQLDLGILDITRHAPDDVNLDNVYDFSENNTTMASWWKTPDTEFIDYEGEAPSVLPDISPWIDATFVLSPKAYRISGEMLKSSGEFLPVLIDTEIYYIFNCLTFGEADEGKSRFSYVEDMKMGLEYLEFKNSVSDLLVFKSKLESCLTLFCGERFKETVETFELTGVLFDKELIPEHLYADG